MNIGGNGPAERIIELERQVAALQAEVALLRSGAPATQRPAMCTSCQTILARGGIATCNCVLFGPKVTCSVATT